MENLFACKFRGVTRKMIRILNLVARRRIYSLLLGGVLQVVVSSCGTTQNSVAALEYSLVGTWWSRASTITTKLELKADGTFIQDELFDSGTTWTYTGSYETREKRLKLRTTAKTPPSAADVTAVRVCDVTFAGAQTFDLSCPTSVQKFSWSPP